VTADEARPVGEHLLVQRHFASAAEDVIDAADGGHGGGDAQLLRDVFVGDDDPLHRAAGWADGVRSVVVGLAGNRSLATGLPVKVADLELGPAAAIAAASDFEPAR
jgi:hypothetical protein